MKNTIIIDGVAYKRIQENSKRVEKLIELHNEVIKTTGNDNDTVYVHPYGWRYNEFDLSEWRAEKSAHGGTSMTYKENSNLTVFLTQEYSEIKKG